MPGLVPAAHLPSRYYARQAKQDRRWRRAPVRRVSAAVCYAVSPNLFWPSWYITSRKSVLKYFLS